MTFDWLTSCDLYHITCHLWLLTDSQVVTLDLWLVAWLIIIEKPYSSFFINAVTSCFFCFVLFCLQFWKASPWSCLLKKCNPTHGSAVWKRTFINLQESGFWKSVERKENYTSALLQTMCLFTYNIGCCFPSASVRSLSNTGGQCKEVKPIWNTESTCQYVYNFSLNLCCQA